MAKGAAKKIIQIPIADDLLERIDETAEAMATSRAAFIREACTLRLQGLGTKKLEQRYVEGYRKRPEQTTWAETGATLLSQILEEEDW
jgi:metal-responsive CopG/Arc/MetJ family transcriptional regulator